MHFLLEKDTKDAQAHAQEETPNKGDDDPVKATPLLAEWGQPLMEATFTTWWKKWKAQGPRKAPERVELARLSRLQTNEAQPISMELAAWFRSVEGPDVLTPMEAREWRK